LSKHYSSSLILNALLSYLAHKQTNERLVSNE